MAGMVRRGSGHGHSLSSPDGPSAGRRSSMSTKAAQMLGTAPNNLTVTVKRLFMEKMPNFGEAHVVLTMDQSQACAANWEALQAGQTPGYLSFSKQAQGRTVDSPLCFLCDTFYRALYANSGSLKSVFCSNVQKEGKFLMGILKRLCSVTAVMEEADAIVIAEGEIAPPQQGPGSPRSLGSSGGQSEHGSPQRKKKSKLCAVDFAQCEKATEYVMEKSVMSIEKLTEAHHELGIRVCNYQAIGDALLYMLRYVLEIFECKCST